MGCTTWSSSLGWTQKTRTKLLFPQRIELLSESKNWIVKMNILLGCFWLRTKTLLFFGVVRVGIWPRMQTLLSTFSSFCCSLRQRSQLNFTHIMHGMAVIQMGKISTFVRRLNIPWVHVAIYPLHSKCSAQNRRFVQRIPFSHWWHNGPHSLKQPRCQSKQMLSVSFLLHSVCLSFLKSVSNCHFFPTKYKKWHFNNLWLNWEKTKI